MFTERAIGPSDPQYPEMKKQQKEDRLETAKGYSIMIGAILIVYGLFGYQWAVGLGLLLAVLPVILPLVLWIFCAQVALLTTNSKPADPNNPEHKRVIDCIVRVFPKTGLKYMPRIFCSPNPLPNAFATGPIPRFAVVAFTVGLLLCGFTDAEIEAIFAHELAHVKNLDVLVNTLLSSLQSIFFQIYGQGTERLVEKAGNPLLKHPNRVAYWTAKIACFVVQLILLVLFRLVQLAVVRSRESLADDTAAEFTGDPCALHSALQKLVMYMENHRAEISPQDLKSLIVLRHMLIVDPFEILGEVDNEPGLKGLLKKILRALTLTHPEMPERLARISRNKGGEGCPVLPGFNPRVKKNLEDNQSTI